MVSLVPPVLEVRMIVYRVATCTISHTVEAVQPFPEPGDSVKTAITLRGNRGNTKPDNDESTVMTS